MCYSESLLNMLEAVVIELTLVELTLIELTLSGGQGRHRVSRRLGRT